MQIIHISDLHFTSTGATLDLGSDYYVMDKQDSPQKAQDIADFIILNSVNLPSKTIVVTGDITDSGDEDDYPIATAFMDKLRDAGFSIYVVPGNHDYCKEGIFCLANVFAKLSVVPAPILDRLLWLINHGDPLQAARKLITKLLKKLFPAGYPSIIIDMVLGNYDRFFINLSSNDERRKRFFTNVTGYTDYPHVVSLPDAELVLLDSMQGMLEPYRYNDILLAQGCLGVQQLCILETTLTKLQAARATRPIVVALHHTPFIGSKFENLFELLDAEQFLNIIRDRIDCLLYGHYGDFLQEDQSEKAKAYGIPIANCENLQKMRSEYPVTIISLTRMETRVWYTDGTIPGFGPGNDEYCEPTGLPIPEPPPLPTPPPPQLRFIVNQLQVEILTAVAGVASPNVWIIPVIVDSAKDKKTTILDGYVDKLCYPGIEVGKSMQLPKFDWILPPNELDKRIFFLLAAWELQIEKVENIGDEEKLTPYINPMARLNGALDKLREELEAKPWETDEVFLDWYDQVWRDICENYIQTEKEFIGSAIVSLQSDGSYLMSDIVNNRKSCLKGGLSIIFSTDCVLANADITVCVRCDIESSIA